MSFPVKTTDGSNGGVLVSTEAPESGRFYCLQALTSECKLDNATVGNIEGLSPLTEPPIIPIGSPIFGRWTTVAVDNGTLIAYYA